MRSSVDLPQPDGPTMVTNSPGRRSRLTFSTACVPSGNTIETWSKRRAWSVMLGATAAGARGTGAGPAWTVSGSTRSETVSGSDIIVSRP